MELNSEKTKQCVIVSKNFEGKSKRKMFQCLVLRRQMILTKITEWSGRLVPWWCSEVRGRRWSVIYYWHHQPESGVLRQTINNLEMWPAASTLPGYVSRHCQRLQHLRKYEIKSQPQHSILLLTDDNENKSLSLIVRRWLDICESWYHQQLSWSCVVLEYDKAHYCWWLCCVLMTLLVKIVSARSEEWRH